jgi:hypothetical protein
LKLIIFSDSHGETDNMYLAVKAEKPDAIIHLGDYDSDCKVFREFTIPLYSVRGNCDWGSDNLVTMDLNFDGKRIFLTHGHTYHVKESYDYIINAAMLMEADVVLFGHTHIPYYDERDGLYVINPGSAGRGAYKGYGVLTIENGKISYERKSM